MWDGFNQRKFPRIQTRCSIGIVPQEGARTITATTENVGLGGVCVVLSESLERFQPCKLKLELSKSSKKIECEAKIAWIVPTKKLKARKTLYDTGIEFVNLDEESQKKLQEFIDQQQPAHG